MAGRPDFDGIARAYRWLEYVTLGRRLERCRFHFLPEIRDRRRALVFGDGDGRFLARLLAANPALQADAVDSSAAMLELLRARCAASSPATDPKMLHSVPGETFDPTHREVERRDEWGTRKPSQKSEVQRRPQVEGRLTTHHSEALAFLAAAGPATQYDLVATHFFLDCLTQAEVEALVGLVAARLAPGAVWLISDFRIPEGRMRIPARVFVGGLYLAFRILTGLRTRRLPDHVAALASQGFVCVGRREFLGGMLVSELWQFGNRREWHTRAATALVSCV